MEWGGVGQEEGESRRTEGEKEGVKVSTIWVLTVPATHLSLLLIVTYLLYYSE